MGVISKGIAETGKGHRNEHGAVPRRFAAMIAPVIIAAAIVARHVGIVRFNVPRRRHPDAPVQRAILLLIKFIISDPSRLKSTEGAEQRDLVEMAFKSAALTGVASWSHFARMRTIILPVAVTVAIETTRERAIVRRVRTTTGKTDRFGALHVVARATDGTGVAKVPTRRSLQRFPFK